MARRKEHDRYCPQAKWSRDDAIEWWDGCQTDFDCRCDLIAKVRDDEQQQVAIRLTAYHAESCIGATSNLGCGCGLWNDVLTYSVELP